MELGNLISLNGRIGRKDYIIISAVILAVGLVLSAATGFDDPPLVVVIIEVLVSLGLGIPNGFKRLHDTGRSGWWLLLGLIPIVGSIALLVILWILPGESGANKYGEPNDGTPFPSLHGA